MDKTSIVSAIENGELTLSVEDIVEVVTSASMNGENINCDILKAVVAGVQAVKKTAMENFKIAQKEQAKADKEVLADRARAYWATLSIGDPVAYKKVDGTILEGTVGEVKEGSKNAHVILNEVPAGAKSDNLNRYPAYNTICVPEDFVAVTAA